MGNEVGIELQDFPWPEEPGSHAEGVGLGSQGPCLFQCPQLSPQMTSQDLQRDTELSGRVRSLTYPGQ